MRNVAREPGRPGPGAFYSPFAPRFLFLTARLTAAAYPASTRASRQRRTSRVRCKPHGDFTSTNGRHTASIVSGVPAPSGIFAIRTGSWGGKIVASQFQNQEGHSVISASTAMTSPARSSSGASVRASLASDDGEGAALARRRFDLERDFGMGQGRAGRR